MHGFHKNTLKNRQKIISEFCNLDVSDMKTLNIVDPKQYDSFIENVIGTYTLPMGVATNFKINSKKYFIPMVTEEPSIIAAASSGAKAVVDTITATHYGPHVIGQIQILNPASDTKYKINTGMEKIKAKIDECLSKHMKCQKIIYETLDTKSTTTSMAKLEIVIDTGDAMGANAVNTVCEGITPLIKKITGKRVLLRILSNAEPRFGYAKAQFDVPKDIAQDIVSAYQFACFDGNRAVTHNKGIMNGITAVAMATGQDTRAIEAAAHMYAAFNTVQDNDNNGNRYGPLSKWEITDDGNLSGEISVPLAVGVIGGMTKHHGMSATALKILGNPNANKLTEIMASVGLCQNFSALRALCVDGIQKGHMKLHQRRQQKNNFK